MIVTARLATYAELDSVLGNEDAQDLLEIAAVNAANVSWAKKRGK